jgi:hypothetical protein
VRGSNKKFKHLGGRWALKKAGGGRGAAFSEFIPIYDTIASNQMQTFFLLDMSFTKSSH